MDANDQFNEFQEEKFKKDTMEFYNSFIANAYDKGSKYTNLIIVAGYASFFTFWSNVRNEVNIIDARLSVIYVVISVSFFIAWEILQMIVSSVTLQKLYKLNDVPPAEFKIQMEQRKSAIKKSEASCGRFWIYQLLITISFGFSGAAILLLSYVKNLLP